MSTVVQSCRLEKASARLLAQQARRKGIEVSTLSSLYLVEKAREVEFPGVGFRDGAGGREAYIQGHRVAVWEVLDIHAEAKSIARTADHLSWPEYLVKCALSYSAAFPADIARERAAEVGE